MPSHLDRILQQTRIDVQQRRSTADVGDLRARALQHQPRGFAKALREARRTRPAVIAELKKASPSRGLIRADFDAASLAVELEVAGAACLSVLTDEPFFQGSLRNLQLASAATRLLCLRKDFIVDEFQILEARANGADAVLLIAAALGDESLRRLRATAGEFDLDVLCEVHNVEELARVADLGCEMYGVNSRDLRSFHVDPAQAEALARQLPAGTVHVAESGIHNAADVARMQAAGYQAFLVGEHLMRAESPGDALRQLLAPAVVPAVSLAG